MFNFFGKKTKLIKVYFMLSVLSIGNYYCLLAVSKTESKLFSYVEKNLSKPQIDWLSTTELNSLNM